MNLSTANLEPLSIELKIVLAYQKCMSGYIISGTKGRP